MEKTTDTHVHTLKTTVTDLPQVDPRNIIVEEGFNERTEDNYGDIPGLALNIVQNGVLEPLIGFKKRLSEQYVVTEGHRRLRAVNYALAAHAKGTKGFEDISKIERIPIRTGSSNIVDRLYTMATTGFGKQPLTELEKAGVYTKLIDLSIAKGMKRGEAIKELVKRLGVSQATVYNTLQLATLPEEIKKAIHEKAISGSTVTTIIRDIKDPAEQIKVVTEAIESAKADAEKDGKATAKKATAKNVKNMKAKTPIAKLEALKEKLEASSINNTRTKAFIEVMEMVKNGASVHKMFELFL